MPLGANYAGFCLEDHKYVYESPYKVLKVHASTGLNTQNA